MPEGPEVKNFADELNRKFANKYLQSILFLSGKYKRKGVPKNYKNFIDELPQKISLISNKGKFIYIILENKFNVWITLGLTGGFKFEKDKHSHIMFKITETTDLKSKEEIFYFDDIRNFGTIYFSLDINELEKKLLSLGPDMLQENIKKKDFINIMKSFKQDKIIGIALVDQKKISGIGNYLRAEILYDAKISPWRKLSTLNENDLNNIYKSIKKILKISYNNILYNTQQNKIYKVYQKNKTDKGENIKKEIMMDGTQKRTIWWVPNIQK